MKQVTGIALALTMMSACTPAASTQETALAPIEVENDLDTVTIKSDSGDTLSLQQASTQTEALKITDGIYQATGFGNTFLVVTDEGNVVIDTSLERNAAAHKKLLDAVNGQAPKYIIATHGHGDHVGGIPIWRGEDTEVIAQDNSVEFLHYQKRLSGFFALRNAAQFGFKLDPAASAVQPGNYDAAIPATILFDQAHQFKLGGMTFDVASAPAETLDALTVWIPEKKAVFIGDLVYESFPNIYTLRGTKPRWALDYAAALNDVLALNAEILIPSHGDAIKGADAVRTTLTNYRDAILYVHDATVAGMNAGEDVYTLMDEIKLPKRFALSENYGTVKWSVRGIYDGYAGWFDGNPSTMLGIEPTQSNAVLVRMAGGADAVAAEAKSLAENGQRLQALALVDSVLSVQPDHAPSLTVRLQVLKGLHQESQNFNEAGWLGHGIRQSEGALKE